MLESTDTPVVEISSGPVEAKINRTNQTCCLQIVLCIIGLVQLILLVVILLDQTDWSKHIASGLVVAYSLIAAQQLITPKMKA